MTDLQKHVLKLLKEIEEICKKNNIEYFLCCGTALGAVRNGGFLPWDDDADISMTPDNAGRFLELEGSFPKDRMLLCRKERGYYPHPWLRYTDTSSSSYKKNTYFYEAPAGISIDIFIIDFFPAESEKEMQQISYRYLLLLENEASSVPIMRPAYYENVKASEDYLLLRSGADETKLEDILMPECLDLTVDRGYFVRRTTYYFNNFVFYPAKIFSKKRMIKFEDTFLPVPYYTEDYLVRQYGLYWWEIPPIEGRREHGFAVVEDLSYRAFKDEFDTYVEKSDVAMLKAKKKDLNIKWRSKKARSFKSLLKSHARIENLRISRKLYNDNECLRTIVKKRDIRKLEDIFSGYYEMQFGLCYDHDAFFDICDEWLYAAFIPLLYRGKLSKVRNIFRLREKEKGIEMSSELSELRQFTADLEFITTNIFTYHNYKEVRKRIDSVEKEWDWQITLIRCDIRLALTEGKEPDEVKMKLIRALEKYPRDGELLKYYADIIYAEGNTDKAIRLYNKALSTLTNGIVKHEIMKIMSLFRR